MVRGSDLTLVKEKQVRQSVEAMRRQTELMTKTPETENIDSIHGRNGGKFKHTRNEED